MKKVCFLTSVHPVFDVRIFHKEAKTLVKADYDVTLIVQHDKNEAVDGIRIIPLPKPKNRFERMTKTAWLLFRLALKQKADVYHFHDPEFVPVGIVLSLLGNKVIYDVHEDVPKQILDKEWIRNVGLRKFIAFVTSVVQQMGTFLFSGIVAATPHIAKKFNPSKTVLIRNLPIVSLIDSTKPLEIKKEKPIIIYAGGLTRAKGIEEIIQAMEFIGDRAELWLLGKWVSEEFKKECEDLVGWSYSKNLGYVALSEVYNFARAADIALCMFHPTGNYIDSLPIKTFEYMAMSLPIIMSHFPYWREVFGECALFADPHDSKDIAETILYLLDNPKLAEQMGTNGRKAVLEKYNWETESEKLLEVYRKLSNHEK